MSYVKICKRCFRPGHSSELCLRDQAIACTRCFRLNFFTTNCCDAPEKSDETYNQAFRIAGSLHPQFYIDLEVFGHNVPCLVSTGIIQSKVDHQMLVFLREQDGDHDEIRSPNSWTIRVPMRLRCFHATLRCNIEETLGSGVRLELGLDFLRERPFTFKLEGLWLTEFNISINIGDTDIPALVHTGIRSSIIDESLLPLIRKNKHKDQYFYEKQQPHRIRVLFTFNGRLLVTSAAVKQLTNTNAKLILGMHFMEFRECIFKLDNITLHTLKSWRTSHHDKVEYVHQHQKGTELQNHLIGRHYILPTNYRRTPIMRNYIPDPVDDKSDDSF